MTHYICQTCGGELVRGEDGSWICQYCKNSYLDEQANANAELLKELFDEFKLEQIANLRRNLYDAINAQYTDSAEVRRICGEIKKLLPDDFMANFYDVANKEDKKQTAELINCIDPAEHGGYIDGVLNFMLKSFSSEFHLPLVNLVERTYRDKDAERLEYFNTRISEEAEKDNLGVYRTSLTRDCFIAYSSKDMNEVYDLVSRLEASGLTCFVAARNLRHGRGAVQNYKAAIEEAIRNCRVFVLVSTKNSRNFACDTLEFELPTLKAIDTECAPAEFRHSYASIPEEYKKHRVELRLDNTPLPTAADKFVREVFDGCEYARSADEIALRVADFKQADMEKGKKKEEGTKDYVAPAPINNEIEALFENIKVHFDFNEFADVKRDCEKIIAKSPRNAMAYLYMLMAEYKVKKQEDLIRLSTPFDDNVNCKKAMTFGDKALKEALTEYNETIRERIRLAELEKQYTAALSSLNRAKNEAEYLAAKSALEQLKNYKNSADLATTAGKRVEEIRTARLENAYSYAKKLYDTANTEAQYLQAAEEFGRVRGYKDAAEMAEKAEAMAKEMAEKAEAEAKEAAYREAVKHFETASNENAMPSIEKEFVALSGYKDADTYRSKCRTRAKQIILKRAEAMADTDDIDTINKAIEVAEKARPLDEADELIKILEEKTKTIAELQKKEKKNSARREVIEKILCGIFLIIVVTAGISAIWLFAIKPVFKYINADIEAIYNNGVALMEEGKFSEALEEWSVFKVDYEYKDLQLLRDECNAAIAGDFKDFILKYSITEYTIPNGVIEIGDMAFSGCESLTSVTIPDSVTSIGSKAFYGCDALTNITIPDSVTSIGEYAFSGCSSLTSITISDSVTSIGVWAFSSCSSLKSITIPDSVTSIGEYAFYGCSSLTSITIPDSVTSIGERAFSGCSSLTSITIPDSVTNIGDYAFYSCKSLTSITIPDSVTSIGDYAFYSCKSLASITIPDSVTSIGERMFQHCKSLASIIIPNSVTSFGLCAFSGCEALESITIPSSVTRIGELAFSSCNSLGKITFSGTRAEWNAISKAYNWNNGGLSTITVLCTDGVIYEWD